MRVPAIDDQMLCRCVTRLRGRKQKDNGGGNLRGSGHAAFRRDLPRDVLQCTFRMWLPPHPGLIKRRQIAETLPEYFDRCPRPPTLATTISGPSATADIEMTRIKGVHGPRNLQVILVREVGKSGSGGPDSYA